MTGKSDKTPQLNVHQVPVNLLMRIKSAAN